MATVRLIPSTYYLSNSTYLSVSNAANMYHNTDNTSYATVTNSRTSTSSYYIYIRGFNFDAVPSDAIVNSISIKLKAYHSGGNTSTIYCYDGTTQVAAAGSTTALTTSATVKTFTNTTVDWDTLKGYGSDFGIRINCRRSSRNTTAHVYIYGAEILVDYTIPVYHTVTSSTDSGTIIPSGATSVLEGDSYELTISGTTPTVTDNGVDVTSQLVASHDATETLIPVDSTYSNFTVTNIEHAYDDADGTDYADLQLAAGGTTGTLYLDIGNLVIPSGATIKSVSCSATLQYNRNNSSSGFTASCQMYAGSTAKGSSTTVVSAGGTDVAKTTFNLSVGSWTASEINSARFYLTATNNASGTARHIYVYGVSFNVTYESDDVIYTYTLTNITTDHVIIVTGTVSSSAIYVKLNGTWVEATPYKKVNGVWVLQTDVTNVFQSGVNYKQG